MRASNVEEIGCPGSGDPWELFTKLAILVVEGRTPGGERGFHAGPHCPGPSPVPYSGTRHVCHMDQPECARAESLVRQLRLMWGVGVGISLEVLVAPECHHGAALARTLSTTSAPAPHLRLIEQWNFTIYDHKVADASSMGWSLVAAVHSFLHFSQLSAWLSLSGGSRPPNILYRLTVTSPVFSSKFHTEVEEHIFPVVHVGQDTSIKVTVKSLPRSNEIPVVPCIEGHEGVCEEVVNCSLSSTKPPESSFSSAKMYKPNSSTASTCKQETSHVEDDLRRSIMKAQLVESKAGRSESPDMQLGESLLDPPHSLSRIPRRYQSPSRSGSPSLETPEHLMCRARQPTPARVRPPDFGPFSFAHSMTVTARQPANPFPWTQARYPNFPQGSYDLHGSNVPPQGFVPSGSRDQAAQSVGVLTLQNQQFYSCQNFSAFPAQCRNTIPISPPVIWSPSPYFQSYLGQNGPFLPTSYFHSSHGIPTHCYAGKRDHEVHKKSCPENAHFEESPITGYQKDSAARLGGKAPDIQADLYVSVNVKQNCDDSTLVTPHDSMQRHPGNVDQSICDMTGSPRVQGTASQSAFDSDEAPVFCSKHGKHFCTSGELSGKCEKRKEDILVPSEGKKDGKTYAKTKYGCFSREKINFELTPKETQEILSVLRQSTPVPPLRLEQHCYVMGVPEVELKSVKDGEAWPGEGISGKASWKPREVLVPTVEGNQKCHNFKIKAAPDRQSHRSKERKYRYQDMEEGKIGKGEQMLWDGTGHDLEDLSDECEPIEDGLSSTEISKYQVAIEAKRIPVKTHIFTARSEPAPSPKESKLLSQSLGKSPFTLCLSALHDISLPESKDCSPISIKSSVKRALDFDDLQYEQSCAHKEAPIRSKICNEFSASTEGNVNSTCMSGSESFFKSTSLLKQIMKAQITAKECSSNTGNESVIPNTVVSELDAHIILSDRESQSHDGELTSGDYINCDINCFSPCSEEDKEVEGLFKTKSHKVPTASDKARFRRSLDSAAHMVFHSKTGLPLTSSPAPMRKGSRFDFDASLNSVAAIKRSTSFHCSSFCNFDEDEGQMADDKNGNIANGTTGILSTSAPASVACSSLLGSFEECVLNGRLEPVSTVHGFSAEIGASGAFCPKHITYPVTVFFYTLCDNDQISSPYMAHINLGKKGYHIPSQGTVQVTLFNPHGTVVKMFVVMYDLSDMPSNSRTFLRQRTLNMPVGAIITDPDSHQWLRYLIHLRFASSKSGKVYLHTDIRMLIFRKSDADAATLHKNNVPFELRSFTDGPTNPKFSPRK